MEFGSLDSRWFVLFQAAIFSFHVVFLGYVRWQDCQETTYSFNQSLESFVCLQCFLLRKQHVQHMRPISKSTSPSKQENPMEKTFTHDVFCANQRYVPNIQSQRFKICTNVRGVDVLLKRQVVWNPNLGGGWATRLKNISQMGSSLQVRVKNVKITHIWNHQLKTDYLAPHDAWATRDSGQQQETQEVSMPLRIKKSSVNTHTFPPNPSSPLVKFHHLPCRYSISLWLKQIAPLLLSNHPHRVHSHWSSKILRVITPLSSAPNCSKSWWIFLGKRDPWVSYHSCPCLSSLGS